MAGWHQNGVLFRWMVVEPAVLLLGNRRWRNRWMQRMAQLEPRYVCEVDYLYPVRCECPAWLLLEPFYSSRVPFCLIDYVLIYRFTPRQVVRKVCCWFWYLRNKVYSRWFCHARLPGFCNIFHQKYHSSQCSLFFFVLVLDFWLYSFLRSRWWSPRGCQSVRKAHRCM